MQLRWAVHVALGLTAAASLASFTPATADAKEPKEVDVPFNVERVEFPPYMDTVGDMRIAVSYVISFGSVPNASQYRVRWKHEGAFGDVNEIEVYHPEEHSDLADDATFAANTPNGPILQSVDPPPGTHWVGILNTGYLVGQDEGNLRSKLSAFGVVAEVDRVTDIEMEYDTVTKTFGELVEGETATFLLTVTPAIRASLLDVENAIPRDTTVVPGSISHFGRVEGRTIVWNLENTIGETLQFKLKIGPQKDGTRFITNKGWADATLSSGESADGSESVTLRFDPTKSVLDVADASPDGLGGLFLPDEKNSKTLASVDFNSFRAVNGIAADGVALLLLRANIKSAKHGKVVLAVEGVGHAGAEIGDLWTTTDVALLDTSSDGGSRDGDPPGATSLTLSPEPSRFPGAKKGSQVAFALYRSARNFDGGTSTAGLRARSVKFTLEVYDEDDEEVVESADAEIDIVRPLVVLQHGTFDSPAGWNRFPLFERSSTGLIGGGVDPEFPFHAARSDFSRWQGAAGYLVDSAPFAYCSLLLVLEEWRQTNGLAGAQADVVCHSYGGVNMRWAAQTQKSTDPVTIDVRNNFRNAANWGHGAFHKLITIASTHRGSAVSNQLAYLNGSGRVPGAIAFAADKQKSWIDRGGVEDQMVLSPRLRQLRRTRVPGHAIAGAGLADFNASYKDRLKMLYWADVPNGPFRQYGSVGFFQTNFLVLRNLSNYGFNLDGHVLADDVSQDPNYDLTVSSYSSKARMPRAAHSDYRDVEDTAGLERDSLSGALTHGDQIGLGGGRAFTTLATAKRVAFLLRQPTASSWFSNFPGVMEAPPTALEAEFSKTSRFRPADLYIGRTESAKASPAAKATAPVLTIVPDVTTVHPGDVLDVTVTWPDVDVTDGVLAFPGETGDGLGPRVFEGLPFVHTVVVPNLQPAPFEIAAFVVAADGDVGTVERRFELSDAEAYTELRATPPVVDLESVGPGTVWFLGKLPNGEWRTLNDSPRLVVTSSDPDVVSIDAGRLLQAGAFGTATVTATFDGGLSATVGVTVSGAAVPVAVAPKKKSTLKRKKKAPADFVFLSGPGFDPAQIDTATVRVHGTKPAQFKLEDYNKDGVMDLAAYVSPRSLALAPGVQPIRISGELEDGTRVSGIATAAVK